MPRVYVLSGPDVGKSWDVADGATFGRSPESSVVLHDASVSRSHARLEATRAGWCIVDAGSRNGVFVRGARVEGEILGDGDEFKLGEVLLRFRAEVDARALDVTRLEPPPAQVHERPPEPEVEVPPASGPAIEFVPRGGAGVAGPPSEDVELEGDWDASAPAAGAAIHDASAAATSGAHAAPRSAAVDARAKKLAAAGVAGTKGSAGVAGRAAEDRGILQYHRVAQREGLFAQDVGQQPLWVRAVIAAVVVALAAGLFWLAYQGALAVKDRVASPVEESAR